MLQICGERQSPGYMDDPLHLSLERLTQALAVDFPGHEGAWAAAVDNALVGLERELRQHTAEAEAPDGLFTEMDLTRPTLVRRVSAFRREHCEFLEQLAALQRQVRLAAQAFRTLADPIDPTCSLPEPTGPGIVPDFGALRRRGQQLAAALWQHHNEETILTLESVTTDIGVGD